MFRFRSANPVFRRVHRYSHEAVGTTEAVSYKGVILKSTYLIALTAITALLVGFQVLVIGEISPLVIGLIFTAPIVGIVCLLITMISRKPRPIASSIYALSQGAVLGLISAIYELTFGDGIVILAVMATFSVFFGMLFLFSTGLVQVTDMLRRFLFMMLMGILLSSLFYFLFVIISGTGYSIGFVFGITVLSVIVASLYLLVDFDNIQIAVQNGYPKSIEWKLSLGLLVTLIWLYIEILRLIAILRSRSGRR